MADKPRAATLSEFRETITEALGAFAFDRTVTEGGGEDVTLVPRLPSANTDVRALIAALPRLHTHPEGELQQELDLGKTLGEGGMGVIRLAEQRSLGREVAVKSLRLDRSGSDAALQLLREDWGSAVSLRDDANGRLPLARDAQGIAGTPGSEAPLRAPSLRPA